MDARWHATWWDNCVSFCETKQSGIKGVKRYFDPGIIIYKQSGDMSS